MMGAKVITTFLDYNSGQTAFQSLEGNINYDEFGRLILDNLYAWTNMNTTGKNMYNSSSSSSCYGFTNSTSNVGYMGKIDQINSGWIYNTNNPCSAINRLICAET